MKNTIILLFGIILSLSASGAEHTNSSPSSLYCEEPNYNAGEIDVEKNNLITHRFVLKNNSGKEISIKEIIASCSCTTAQASKRKVASGSEVFVDVTATVEKQNFSGFSAELIVRLNDETVSTIPLKITAQAVYSPYLNPTLLDFGKVNLGGETKLTRRVYLCMPSKEPLKEFVKAIEATNKMFTATVLSQTQTRKTDNLGKSICLTCAVVDISLIPSVSMSSGPETINFNITGDKKVSLVVKWEKPSLEIFSPNLFFVQGDKDVQVMQLTYNSLMGGIPTHVKFSDSRFSIEKTTFIPPCYVYTVKYTKPTETQPSATESFLFVRNKENKEHLLKFIIE